MDEDQYSKNVVKRADRLYNNLRRLFSNDVIIRNVGGKKIKTIDTNQIQKAMIDGMNHYTGYGSGPLGRGMYHQNNYGSSYGGAAGYGSYNYGRYYLYQEYEAMDNDPILNSALDIIADECVTKNVEGDILKISSSDENIKAILDNLFYDIINIDFNLRSWIRNMCKYGDFFLKLNVAPDYGIIGVDPMSAYEVTRDENEIDEETELPKVVFRRGEGNLHGGGGGFGGMHTVGHSSGDYAGQMETYEKWEIAHFRMIADTNFLPYGRSMLENSRKIWKMLALMEDAMLIHRIMRAPEKRLFKHDVGNIPPAEIDTFMEGVINRMKKIPFVDEKSGEYNLRFNLQNMVEDFHIPVRGADSGTQIESLGGLEWTGIEDIEYLKNRMLASVKVPKSYLSYEEDLSGKGALASQDVRFARTIEWIQKIFVSELYNLAIVHLFAQGYTDESLMDFDLELTNPSIIYEQERIEAMSSKVSLARDMKDTGFDSNHIYDTIFGLDEQSIRKIQNGIVEDKKFEYRLEQIQQEGNDPAITGKFVDDSMGAGGADFMGESIEKIMNEDELEEETEYIKKDGTKVTYDHPDDDNFGRDPLGKKESGRISNRRKTKSPLAIESELKSLDKFFNNMEEKKILTEQDQKHKVVDKPESSVLDDSNLIDDDSDSE
jgi:hypothetical protein